MTARKTGRGSRARSIARKLAMQALYQWQLTGEEPDAAVDLLKQYAESDEYPGADADYFAELVAQCIARHEEFDVLLGTHADRPVAQLDPVEHAILLIGLYEVVARADVPGRVVINEAVELSKRFGATDGYKYINALLDRIVRGHRIEA